MWRPRVVWWLKALTREFRQPVHPISLFANSLTLSPISAFDPLSPVPHDPITALITRGMPHHHTRMHIRHYTHIHKPHRVRHTWVDVGQGRYRAKWRRRWVARVGGHVNADTQGEGGYTTTHTHAHTTVYTHTHTTHNATPVGWWEIEEIADEWEREMGWREWTGLRK